MVKKRPSSPGGGEESALRLLGIRDYSREEMRRKLTAKGFGAGEVEEVVRKLEVRGLIDDLRYARRLAGYYAREKLWGRPAVIHRLVRRGIEPDTARHAADLAEEEGPTRERLEKALRIKLKGKGPAGMLPREKMRVISYLRYRGFLLEDIMEAFREAGGSTEE